MSRLRYEDRENLYQQKVFLCPQDMGVEGLDVTHLLHGYDDLPNNCCLSTRGKHGLAHLASQVTWSSRFVGLRPFENYRAFTGCWGIGVNCIKPDNVNAHNWHNIIRIALSKGSITPEEANIQNQFRVLALALSLYCSPIDPDANTYFAIGSSLEPNVETRLGQIQVMSVKLNDSDQESYIDRILASASVVCPEGVRFNMYSQVFNEMKTSVGITF